MLAKAALPVVQYDQQVSGQSLIVKIFDDHIVKYTNVYETRSYRRMTEEMRAVGPRVCTLIHEGMVTQLRECHCAFVPENAETIERLRQISAVEEKNFLIMIDEVHGMIRPRLLDLKLGTRTFSDRKSEAKLGGHLLKAVRSCTTSIGLRICGMVVEPSVDQKRIHIKKPDARYCSIEEFAAAMGKFFVAEEQKVEVVRQLRKIMTAVRASESHRFFGSSIFIAIDDGATEGPVEKSVVVKIIDFASMSTSQPGEPQYLGPDTGALFGLENLIKLLVETSMQ